jgi:tetratricopeptide (TPR) repeat protein
MRPSGNLFLVVAMAAMAIAGPAYAQESSDYPPACDASKVSQADIDRAHTVFLSGKQFLEESNYDKAISYFKDAYSIDCSRHAMLPIIATAFERKGDRAEAVRALEEYARRAPGAADHDVIERRIKNLKDQLAREQPPPAPLPSPTAAAPPPPPPAPTPVESTAPTAMSATPTTTTGGHTAAPWVITAVGGVIAGGGAVLLGVGSSDVSSADSQCPDRGHCRSQSAVDTGNRGRSLLNGGGVLLGGGLVVAAAGLLWHFLEKPASPSAAATTTTRPRVEALAGPGCAAISLRGSF